MASFAASSAKISAALSASSQANPTQQQTLQHQRSVSFRSDSRSNPALLSRFQGGRKQSDSFKPRAQLNDVVEKSANSKPAATDIPETKAEESTKTEYSIPDASAISAFMSQAADLIELVDSRDIVELQLKQMDCEIIIRKKEALQPPPAAAPIMMQQPAFPQAMYQPQMPPPVAEAPAAASAPAPAALPPPAAPQKKSSHPPLKSPMAGTFYRAPAPGAPPFVKVGDKVQKGQVVCIVEAMKLMNEIEADKSGTVVEIVAEDAKPVSLDSPLLIIQP